jgi:hypothetical protein
VSVSVAVRLHPENNDKKSEPVIANLTCLGMRDLQNGGRFPTDRDSAQRDIPHTAGQLLLVEDRRPKPAKISLA